MYSLLVEGSTEYKAAKMMAICSAVQASCGYPFGVDPKTARYREPPDLVCTTDHPPLAKGPSE